MSNLIAKIRHWLHLDPKPKTQRTMRSTSAARTQDPAVGPQPTRRAEMAAGAA